VPISVVAESSGDVQTPVTNEGDCDNGAVLYKATTLNDGHPAVIMRTDSVGHDSTGAASGNSERLSESHTPASVDV
jgi:hypothetical protein